MVRSYSRHGPTECFSIIHSPPLLSSASASATYFLPAPHHLAFSVALEDVLVWNYKTGDQVAALHATGVTSAVTACSPTILGNLHHDRNDNSRNGKGTITIEVAVGYADGSIRVFSVVPANENPFPTPTITLDGHRKAVTALTWDAQVVRLASGSTDGEIIIWDARVEERGLFRLRLHRSAIRRLNFLPTELGRDTRNVGGSSSSNPNAEEQQTHLLSASKDSLLKVTDLRSQHCIETVFATGEIWDSVVLRDYSENVENADETLDQLRPECVVISGSGDGQIGVWKLDEASMSKGLEPGVDGKLSTILHPLPSSGILPSGASGSRISQISTCTIQDHKFLGILTWHDKSVEIFRLRGTDEIKRKIARKRKRAKAKGQEGAAGGGDEKEEGAVELGWKDRLVHITSVRSNTTGKIRSFSFPSSTTKSSDAQILLSLASNSLELHSISLAASLSSTSSTKPDAVLLHSLNAPGHQTDIKALALSPDDRLLASASAGSLKLWNVKSTKCIRTIPCGPASCGTFLVGDGFFLIGTKNGSLELFDLASSTLIQEVPKAHSGSIRSVQLQPDGRGLVTGAEKEVKFWAFETRQVRSTVEEEGPPPPQQSLLSLRHSKTLKMTDDVLAVRYSPDGRLLAVAMLDSTVKVFFADSLKFSLSLYGHKLPVLGMDISHDSKLIVTCSADKNVKIWGLDFGDCHRSLFAHDDSVTQVVFEAESHCFWTVSKDKVVKYWDGDKFECIQKMEGHHGEVWSLATSHQGKFVATASNDRSIRVWEKLDEPLFLQEERERELEQLYTTTDEDAKRIGLDDLDGAPESSLVQKESATALTFGERILEALEVYNEDKKSIAEYERIYAGLPDSSNQPPRQLHAILQAYGDIAAERHVLNTIQKVPASHLFDALAVLSFQNAIALIECLDYWASKEWSIALVSRIMVFLLRTHGNQIIATRVARNTLVSLKGHLQASLRRQKSLVGYNAAALAFFQRKAGGDRIATTANMAGGEQESRASAVKRKRVVL